jgi:hypothetical protein
MERRTVRDCRVRRAPCTLCGLVALRGNQTSSTVPAYQVKVGFSIGSDRHLHHQQNSPGYFHDMSKLEMRPFSLELAMPRMRLCVWTISQPKVVSRMRTWGTARFETNSHVLVLLLQPDHSTKNVDSWRYAGETFLLPCACLSGACSTTLALQ